jgi:hypothetical protein
MSKVTEKFIKFGTNTNEVNSRSIPANYTPSSYTPAQVDSEGDDKVSSHLKGIDSALSSAGGNPNDIAETSYTKTTGVDQALSNENITNLAFTEASIRSFTAHVSIQIDTTADKWAYFTLEGIQRGSGVWSMSSTSVGDDTGITFDIASVSSSGQVRYSVAADASRTAINMKFRAICLSV